MNKTELLEEPNVNQSRFLYVSQSRFVIMSIVTVGLWETYWIYKNWRYLKERDNLDIMPVWRALFGIFFIHSLLSKIKGDKEVNLIEKATFSSGFLAAGWIIVLLIGNFCGRSDDFDIQIVGYLISTSSFLFLLPVQKAIIRTNSLLTSKPEYYGWSLGQIVCLVIGVPLFLLVLIGVFYG
ncbi:hypothetical protein E9993_11710 [Labilibacter sediminis]|nr:hypothetical protein E9993_11710 [Labilibacter sediminis]